MNRLIAIIGPTAVGKTALSIDLAQKLDTEIISGDSMLIYKGMDIGTAKPGIRERRGIKHHLVDILDPTQDFNAVQFQQLAAEKIKEINQQGKIPLLVGGTGLYVKALLEGYQFNDLPGDEKLRTQLTSMADQYGNEYLHTMLMKVEPVTAKRLHPNDIRRIIRALEVHYTAGVTVSQQKAFNQDGIVYDAVVIALTMDRAILYERINKRVDIMMQQGLVAEVERLLDNGVPPESQAMQGIGYKEIVSYLHNQTDLSTAIDNIKKATRHFAKRQLTWYRRMPYIHWVDIDKFVNYDKMFTYIYKFMAGKFNLE